MSGVIVEFESKGLAPTVDNIQKLLASLQSTAKGTESLAIGS